MTGRLIFFRLVVSLLLNAGKTVKIYAFLYSYCVAIQNDTGEGNKMSILKFYRDFRWRFYETVSCFIPNLFSNVVTAKCINPLVNQMGSAFVERRRMALQTYLRRVDIVKERALLLAYFFHLFVLFFVDFGRN